MIYIGLKISRLIHKFKFVSLLFLLASCNLQSVTLYDSKVSRNSALDKKVICLEEMVKITTSNSRISSRKRSSTPSLIRLHGKKDIVDSFQAHVSIDPNGILIKHLSDFEIPDVNLGSDMFPEQGLHIQILDQAGLVLDSPITDAQYSTLASQLVIWQLKYGITVARITSENTTKQARSSHDLQVQLDWIKLKLKMNKLKRACNSG